MTFTNTALPPNITESVVWLCASLNIIIQHSNGDGEEMTVTANTEYKVHIFEQFSSEQFGVMTSRSPMRGGLLEKVPSAF